MEHRHRQNHVHYRIVTSGVIVHCGKLLLIRRSQADQTLAGYWEMPGGKREHGETSQQSVVREVREEAGLDVQVREPISVFEYVLRNSGGVFDVTQLNFRCTPRHGLRVRLSREHDAFGWFTAAQIRRLKPVTPETKRAALQVLGK